MKVWKVFVALLFVTSTLHAQTPFCGYPYVQPYYPYYPGAYYSLPFCPQAYYPQPYFPQSYFPQAYFPQSYFPQYPQLPYASFQLSTGYDYETVNALTRQVQQLNDQVRQLQAQIAFAEAQPPQPSPAEVAARTPRPPATPMTFVFKNGTQITAPGYAVAGQTLWILTPSGSVKTALSNLDVVLTQRENLKVGITFEIPAG